MQRRRLLVFLAAVPAVSLIPGEAQARPVSLEEIVSRVRERVTDKFFVLFEPDEINSYFGLAVKWVNAHFEEPFTLEEVCREGDPLADTVAWGVVAMAAFALSVNWVWEKPFPGMTQRDFEEAEGIKDRAESLFDEGMDVACALYGVGDEA